MTMKQFSLKDYLANPSRKVVTRDGRPVRILCTDAKAKYPVIGLVLCKDGEVPNNYTKNGVYLNSVKSDSDIFFAPEKKVAWANLYCTELGTTFSGDFYQTEEAALQEKVKDLCKYITTFKVEWEE